MKTHIILKKEELDQTFLDHIKSLFKDTDELEISIGAFEDFNLYKEESQNQYFERLEKAIREVDNNKISFSEQEFFKMAQENDL